MSFAASRIARSIVDQLASALPESAHVSLTATDSTLRICDDRTSTSVEVRLSAFGDGERLSAREAETATQAVLSTIQDVVIEALTVPWPTPDANPEAVVRDGILTAWLGTEDAPILRFDNLAQTSP